MNKIHRFKENKIGKDFCVGDCHGHFRKLEHDLSVIGFDESKDRLFAVGDLVDRHDDSGMFLEFLDQPWFFSVLGNHELMLIDAVSDGECSRSARLHYENGGDWLYLHDISVRKHYASILKELPLAIEIETKHGLVGIVHAEVPYNDWNKMKLWMNHESEGKNVEATTLWARTKIDRMDETKIENIHHVYVGHTHVGGPITLGNVTYTDCGAWFRKGQFKILQIN